MAKVKDKFRDWNLFHKSIVAGMVALGLSVLVKAYFAIDGAYELKEERVIPASAADIWPWVTDNLKRPYWQGEVIRVQGLSTDVGRRRLLFWQRQFENWRSSEITTALVQERLFRVEQESDFDTRWLEVELTPIGPCETKVTMTEIIQPSKFSDRFFFYRIKEKRQERLTKSLPYLENWVLKSADACAP